MPFQKGHKGYGGRKKKVAEVARVPDVIPIDIVTPELPQVEAKMPDSVSQLKNNMTRHTIGIMSSIEDMFGSVLRPKCRICYQQHGWLTKCICK